MHELLKLIAEDKSGGVGAFVLFGMLFTILFTYWFFEGAAKLVRAFRGK